MKKQTASIFLHQDTHIPIIDVRAPSEFEAGHIPGAYSIPLFSDEERAAVGTTYKQKGQQEAILLGLQIVGPKMHDLALQAQKYAVDGQLKVHCWRGGMRSQSMAWLFETTGLRCFLLEGGYKAYRQQALDTFAEIEALHVIHGPTGSGKTAILAALDKLGEQVIDLEALAHHKGSAFGWIGMGAQPSTEQFQNDLYQAISHLDPMRRIWVEGESKAIGKVYLPEVFWNKMQMGHAMVIDVPKHIRVERLVADYGVAPKEDLAESIRRISRKFGGNRVKDALQYLEQGDLAAVADMLLSYYDKTYAYAISQSTDHSTRIVHTESGDPMVNAQLLMAQA